MSLRRDFIKIPLALGLAGTLSAACRRSSSP